MAILPLLYYHLVFSPEANYLTATVITEHEEADLMKYALAVISKDTKLENCLQEEYTLANSGWIQIEPNIQRQISVSLDSPPKENFHIVIAAKLAPNSHPNYAGCRWLNFYLGSDSGNIKDNLQPEQTVSKITTTINIRNASLDSSEEHVRRVQTLGNENEGKIQVHPCCGIDTVAVLSGNVPKNTLNVQAIVCTENEKASAIEYGMAVIETVADSEARLAVQSGNFALGFSGWHRVEANTPYQINVELSSPTKADCHLVLATRLPEDSSQAYAWARWLLNFDYLSNVETEAIELVGEQI